MGLMLLVTGIFLGISIFIATMYSLAQVAITEGRPRIAHALAILAMLAVMGALQYREIDLARLFALPLLAAAMWAMWVETRWFRLFPVIHQLFAVALIAGYVAL